MKAKMIYMVAVLALVFSLAAVLMPAGRATAEIFNIDDGDVAGLIAAINASNLNSEPDTINLAAGGTYILNAVNNTINGPNGLPSINSTITINGNGATIQRSSDGGTLNFRIFHVEGTGNVSMYDLTIRNGKVTGFHGGGIRNYGELTLTNCTISGNTADDGGGIYNDGGQVTLTNCTVSGNNASNDGGGINTIGPDTTLTMTDCTISGNTADDGGGIYNFFDEVTLTNCTVSGNMAGYDGGGIYNNRGSVNMTNCTVSGNKAKAEYQSAHGSSFGPPFGPPVNSDGGGIYTVGGEATVTLTVTLNYCTITDNTAEGSGGGIYNIDDTVVLKCTIVYGNTLDDNIVGGHDADLCSIVGGADVRLGPLQNNGGPTKTHALLTDSPAIDTCDCDCSVDTDQRGLPRPVDGDIDGTYFCDVGAYERQVAVGGIVEPVDRIGILAPWLGLVAFLAIAMVVVVLFKNRRAA